MKFLESTANILQTQLSIAQHIPTRHAHFGFSFFVFSVFTESFVFLFYCFHRSVCFSFIFQQINIGYIYLHPAYFKLWKQYLQCFVRFTTAFLSLISQENVTIHQSLYDSPRSVMCCCLLVVSVRARSKHIFTGSREYHIGYCLYVKSYLAVCNKSKQYTIFLNIFSFFLVINFMCCSAPFVSMLAYGKLVGIFFPLCCFCSFTTLRRLWLSWQFSSIVCHILDFLLLLLFLFYECVSFVAWTHPFRLHIEYAQEAY